MSRYRVSLLPEVQNWSRDKFLDSVLLPTLEHLGFKHGKDNTGSLDVMWLAAEREIKKYRSDIL